MPEIVYLKYIAFLKIKEKITTKWVKRKQSLPNKIVIKIIWVCYIKSQTVK